MNYLLKIVEGPMKGAEIALVNGLRVKVGSGETCDIVLADSSLPEVAFELDVAEDTVMLVRGEEAKTLVPYEIVPVGMTSIVIGPANAPWASLHKAPAENPETEAPKDAPSEESEAGAPPVAENPLSEKPAAEGDAESPAPVETEAEKKDGFRWLLWLSFLLLILLAVWLVWHFWPQVTERCPWAERAWNWTSEKCRGGYGWAHDKVCPPEPVVVPGPTLQEIARDAGLVLSERQGRPLLSGNLRLRTERLAVRSLALAENPQVLFDVTDDETLRQAAEELLFVVGATDLHVTAASNRVVTLAGYSPTAAALEKAVRALNADVKGLGGLVTKDIRVGGTPPPKPGAPVFDKPADEKKAPRSRGTVTPAALDFPIAGILTAPYRCVVLRSGLRLAEGGQIGPAVIQRIEADRLILRNGTTTFEWKP